MPVLLVLSNVLATLGLLGVVVALGVPIYALARRIGLTDRAPLGLCWLFGLAWLSAWSWYGLVAGIRPTAIYRALVIALPILGGTALVALRPRREQGLRGGRDLGVDAGLDLSAFTATVLVYTALIFSKLRPGDLPWATILDGDIYVYLKSAAWLGFHPVVAPSVGYVDLQSAVRHDVFGCFNLLAFGRFALGTGLDNLAIPTLGMAVGMVGVAVARSCRLVFRLGVPLSLAVALTTTTGPLFLYVVLNYFLSQTVFVSLLLTVVLQALEPDRAGAREAAGRSLVLAAGAVAAVLCYDVWALQFALLVAALFAVADVAAVGLGPRRRLFTLALSVTSRVALALGAMAAVTPTRLLDSLDKLRTDSVPNVAGWPLPFVDLNLLAGLPVEWQGMDVPRAAVAGPVLGFLLLLGVLVLAAAKLDRGPGLTARRLTLGCFCASLLAYLAVWLKFGEAYQQWKFASTLPLGFGFAVLASALRLVKLEAAGVARVLAGAGSAAFLAACVVLNVGIARDDWMANLAHHPAALADLARSVDAVPGGGPVHVTIDDFNARHAALVALNHRPTTFDGGTMFGPATAPPGDRPWTEITTPCGPGDAPSARYEAVSASPGYLPVLPAGRRVALSGEVATCVALSGFGPAIPQGREVERSDASIRFRCGCPPVPGGYEVVVEAGLADGVEHGSVRLTIAGGDTETVTLTDSTVRAITVPLPPAVRADDAVDVGVAMTQGGKGSGATNGLIVAGMSVRRRT